MAAKGPRYPNKYLVFSIFLILIGIVLLLWTGGYLRGLEALWPVIPLVLGLGFLYAVFLRNARQSYVFLGMFLTLGGAVMLLMTTVMTRVDLIRIWPVFMTVTGVSLVAYGMKKRGVRRISLTIPGYAIVVLSLVFLPFSLDLIRDDFIEAVGTWWPSLFVVLGVVLLFVYFSRRQRD